MNKIEANGRSSEPIRVAEIGREFMPTRFGDFTYVLFQTEQGLTYPVLIKETPDKEKLPLVRVHSKCVTGDLLGSFRCDCGPQLHLAMKQVGKEGGIIVYASDHEGRSTGLVNKLNAYKLMEEKPEMDTVQANLALNIPVEARDYGIAAAVLKELGMKKIRLLSNNPHKKRGLERNGIVVVELVPIEIPPNNGNKKYLETKAAKMGHKLSLSSNGK